MKRQQVSTTKKALEQLLRLCESRQASAWRKYQQQNLKVEQARLKFDRRQLDLNLVEKDQVLLQQMMKSAPLASNILAQQQIQIRRRWLKYDLDKTRYFLNDAKSDLDAENDEASRMRADWMAQRNKYQRYQDKYSASEVQRKSKIAEIINNG